MDKTSLYNVSLIKREAIAQTLKEVYAALEERGYNPVNQIVGYLMSGDPGYISSHKEARSKISQIDRTKILEVLVEKFIK